MLNSFYRKLLFIYMSITLVSILAISGIIGHSMRQKTYERSEKLLQEKLIQVEEMSKDLLDGAMTAKDFRKQVNVLERTSDVHVSIIRHPKQLKDSFITLGEEPQRKAWVEKVLSGEQVTVTSTFAVGSKMNMLIVGQPMMRGDQVIGAVFLYTPVMNIQGAVRSIYRGIFVSALLIALLAAAVLYAVSRHFAGPLLQMSRTAEALATGDFSRRVPVRGRDEIASLAGSLNRMAGKLERVEEGRKRFISEISHELRTPLTTIRASLQGIVDGIVEPEEQREFIQVSLDEAKRLSLLADDLLQLSAFEEKQLKLNPVRIDMAALIAEVVTALTLKAKDKEIELRQDPGDTPYVLEADADKIKQVLINLLDNAIKHVPAGSCAGIRVKALKSEKWLEVWDNGQGIPPEKLPYLFDRFYKADESRSPSGAGLGLTICKQIVEAHGGTIKVRSEAGSGTVFSVFLPAQAKSNL